MLPMWAILYTTKVGSCDLNHIRAPRLRLMLNIMEVAVLCPYCADMDIERVPHAKLYAEHLPSQATPIAASVFHCSQWHIFATFPTDEPTRYLPGKQADEPAPVV